MRERRYWTKLALLVRVDGDLVIEIHNRGSFCWVKIYVTGQYVNSTEDAIAQEFG